MATGEELRERRLRERLKPLEALLARGAITQQQFETKRREVLNSLEKEPVILSSIAELQVKSYLSKVIQRLWNEGFDCYENVTYNNYFFKYVAQNIKFKWMLGSVEAFFVFSEFSSIDIYSLREFSANCLEYAKKARSSSPFWRGLICFPVAIVDSTDRATLEYIRNKAPPRDFAVFEMPVVYDLNSNTLYYFEKTPFYGWAAWGRLRESIQRLLAQ